MSASGPRLRLLAGAKGTVDSVRAFGCEQSADSGHGAVAVGQTVASIARGRGVAVGAFLLTRHDRLNGLPIRWQLLPGVGATSSPIFGIPKGEKEGPRRTMLFLEREPHDPAPLQLFHPLPHPLLNGPAVAAPPPSSRLAVTALRHPSPAGTVRIRAPRQHPPGAPRPPPGTRPLHPRCARLRMAAASATAAADARLGDRRRQPPPTGPEAEGDHDALPPAATPPRAGSAGAPRPRRDPRPSPPRQARRPPPTSRARRRRCRCRGEGGEGDGTPAERRGDRTGDSAQWAAGGGCRPPARPPAPWRRGRSHR